MNRANSKLVWIHPTIQNRSTGVFTSRLHANGKEQALEEGRRRNVVGADKDGARPVRRHTRWGHDAKRVSCDRLVRSSWGHAAQPIRLIRSALSGCLPAGPADRSRGERKTA
jgi:hypothetical protein